MEETWGKFSSMVYVIFMTTTHHHHHPPPRKKFVFKVRVFSPPGWRLRGFSQQKTKWFLDFVSAFYVGKSTLWGMLESELSQMLLHTLDTHTKPTQAWISSIFDMYTPFVKLISRP